MLKWNFLFYNNNRKKIAINVICREDFVSNKFISVINIGSANLIAA